MQRYAKLLDDLYYTYSHLEKIALLKQYFEEVSDPDRGYALALIDDKFSFKYITRNFIKPLMYEYIDPVLFDLSYDYVGDLSETIAHLWKAPDSHIKKPLPALHSIITYLSGDNKKKVQDYFIDLLNDANVTERWAILKIGFHNLRIGVSSRFLKQALAAYGNKTVEEIEEIWHSLSPPYETLFAWLENKGEKPSVANSVFYTPVMLCQPIKDKELPSINAVDYVAEYKYDGIRSQLVNKETSLTIFSRKGENITESFPELTDFFSKNSLGNVVLDGELVVKTDDGFQSFQQLQQRLNRKKPSKKLIQTLPTHIILFDMLFLEGESLRALPFSKRREILENWLQTHACSFLSLSPLQLFNSNEDLHALRQASDDQSSPIIEGLVLKRKESAYISGRPAGQWYKWKRDPFLIDAVLMYAQRGHGKRSSFYSDYTFGVWKDDILLPIGKAYFGFTDEELKKLDRWVRQHIIKKFGPVAEVEKQLVFEVAFENIAVSSRHKAGYALRFPRINRIRWDKPAQEADQLDALINLSNS